MKKLIIGGLVGGIILFMCQFLSWTVLGTHNEMIQSSPKQAEILDYLNQNLEEGFYYMPMAPATSSMEEAGKFMEANNGKPWAQVYFHKAQKDNMASNSIRGIIVDIICILLLVWVFMKLNNPSFVDIFLSCLVIGFIGYLSHAYTNSIWYETKSMGDLLDALVTWSIIGVWLGWWLRR